MERRFRVSPRAAINVIRTVISHPANRRTPVKAVCHFLACEARARLAGGPVITSIGKHSRVLAHLHSGSSWRAVKANPPDWAEMMAWRQLLRPGDTFVDVGANAGLYSLWALDLGAEVIAIEPDHAMAQQLRVNLRLNGYKAEVFEIAASSTTGRMGFGGPDLLRQHLVLASNSNLNTVEVRRLDDVLGNRKIRGMKIDVEGAERLVLQGSSRLLSEGRIEVIQLEWNECSQTLLGEDRRPLAELLRREGYCLCRPNVHGILSSELDDRYGSDMFAVAPFSGIRASDEKFTVRPTKHESREQTAGVDSAMAGCQCDATSPH